MESKGSFEQLSVNDLMFTAYADLIEFSSDVIMIMKRNV